MKFALVAAVEENNGLGKNNTLVWKLPVDMKHFTDITTKTSDPSKRNAVIMGRKTWESIPEKRRPLRNRYNIFLTRNLSDEKNQHLYQIVKNDQFIVMDSLGKAITECESRKDIENIYIIGGAMLYAEAINHPDCQTIYLTRIHKSFDCDAFFPEIDEKIFKIKNRSKVMHENDMDFEFLTYEKE